MSARMWGCLFILVVIQIVQVQSGFPYAGLSKRNLRSCNQHVLNSANLECAGTSVQKNLGCHMIFEGITQLQGVQKPPLPSIDPANPYAFINTNPTLLAALKKVCTSFIAVIPNVTEICNNCKPSQMACCNDGCFCMDIQQGLTGKVCGGVSLPFAG